METKDNYNPLNVKEGLIPRFVKWLKKRIKIISTIGFLTLIFTAWPVIKPWFWPEPDVAQQINGTLLSLQKDYNSLKPVDVPDSLLGNNEVIMLKKYQQDFEVYKLRMAQIDQTNIKASSEEKKRMFYYTRINQVGSYLIEAMSLHETIKKIAVYESTIRTGFIDCIDMQHEVKVDSLENAYFAELAVCGLVHNKGKELQLTEEQKRDNYNKIEILLGEQLLTLITEQDVLYKNFYIQCSIRLKEILKKETL